MQTPGEQLRIVLDIIAPGPYVAAPIPHGRPGHATDGVTMGRLGDYLHESGYRIAGRVYLFLGFIFLLLPIAFLVLFSFQKNVYPIVA